MPRRRVLVTGASGFIGRWSIPSLLRRDYEVYALVSRPFSPDRPMPEELAGAQVVVADLLAPGSVERVVEQVAPSHLLHFAWDARPGLYWTSLLNFEWVAASLALVQAFHRTGGRRAVMAGSCAEYDWTRADVCIEGHSPLALDDDGATPYAVGKAALQRLMTSFGRQAGLSTAWGRIFFQYGPYESPKRLVSSVILDLLAGREALCSHGRQIRNFLHAADVGDAFAALLDSTVEGPVNIGSEQRGTIAELITTIADRIGRPDLIRLGARTAPPGEPTLLVPAIRRLYDEVGWRPSIPLDDGLDGTIAWWRAQPTDR